ncbi:MutS-related protein [Fodinibius salsisoli]|uniref:DNA mismatch repair proteins mutS family domain-containing protein n=1 Tax=Fodinibius salsisoli TaxID=2820877 RepID=A0ABT3PR89_9BACT|nr:hypothetical protein [Fodinibius salsisoli]MCW9708345.1 hypothetical protein [Fodinibius salsisoli]
MSYTSQSLRQALQNQLRRLQQHINQLTQQDQRLSMLRLAAFVGGLVLIYLAGSFGPEWLFWITMLAFIGGFYTLVKMHRQVEQSLNKFTTWKAIRSRHLARQSLNWQDIPPKTPSQSYTQHPFASDLDILGQHSLLQLIDTGNYQGSTDVLAKLLLNQNPDPKAIEERQLIIKELVRQPQFRDQLHLLAHVHHEQELEDDWTLEQLRDHLNKAEPVNYTFPLAILGSLSALNLLLLFLYLIGVIGPYIVFTYVLYLGIYNFNSDKISGLFDEASQIQKLLGRFHPVLEFLEHHSYRNSERLKDFCTLFWNSADSPSRYVHQIIRIASAAASQNSELVWLLINSLVPWDLYYTQKLSRYKQELAPRLSSWIDRFYQLEAFSSLANFAWLNPQYSFALPDPKAAPPLEATDLGHPLLPESEKITNDITIHEKGDILLITGSNMAGKSTFLRTIGINLALCYSGGVVNASSFSTIPFRLFSSINVSDSLDNGLSHFYAEVKQLRQLLSLLEDNQPMPVFFLVDEIYRGTNNRERLQGSQAFLRNVAGKNGVGLVSTHDLELAQLEETIPQLSNWHFAETIEGEKMSFTYKLKPGPCPSTNALKIMQMEGLPT